MNHAGYLPSFLMIMNVTFSLMGCHHAHDEASQVASILEHNDIELVFDSKRDPLSQTVGSLSVMLESEGERFVQPICTAIRLGKAHLLTASHCVKEHQKYIFNPWFLAAEEGEEPSQLQVMRFGNVLRLAYSGDLKSQGQAWAKEAPTLSPPVFINHKLDYAIFALSPLYIDAFKGLGAGISLTSDTQAHTQETFEEMRQVKLWSHPHGAPLTQSPCTRLIQNESQRAFHDCDALSGSSGGLIGSWAFEGVALAMHLAGPGQNEGQYWGEHGEFETPEIFATRRGCPSQGHQEDQQNCVIRYGFNRALPLKSIWNDLMSKNPTLAHQL
jgi:V8-like Glu-specific endopeptidase